MNQSNFYPNQGFPGQPLYQGGTPVPNQSAIMDTEIPLQQSYIENILRLNKGKKVDVFMTFTDSTEWRDKVFSGIIEQSGRDHIILSNPQTGEWYLLQMIYMDYVEFHEPINYSNEFVSNL